MTTSAGAKASKSGVGAAFQERYLEVVASIYLYNEFRGYTALDRVLEAVRARCPDEAEFIAAVVIHRGEPSHFLPYQAWLETNVNPRGTWREKLADWSIHKLLMLVKLPALFFDSGARRLDVWPDTVSA